MKWCCETGCEGTLQCTMKWAGRGSRKMERLMARLSRRMEIKPKKTEQVICSSQLDSSHLILDLCQTHLSLRWPLRAPFTLGGATHPPRQNWILLWSKNHRGLNSPGVTDPPLILWGVQAGQLRGQPLQPGDTSTACSDPALCSGHRSTSWSSALRHPQLCQAALGGQDTQERAELLSSMCASALGEQGGQQGCDGAPVLSSLQGLSSVSSSALPCPLTGPGCSVTCGHCAGTGWGNTSEQLRT